MFLFVYMLLNDDDYLWIQFGYEVYRKGQNAAAKIHPQKIVKLIELILSIPK